MASAEQAVRSDRDLVRSGRTFASIAIVIDVLAAPFALAQSSAVIAFYVLALVGLVLGLVGLVRIVGGLHYAAIARAVLAIALLVPAINVVILAIVVINASRGLHE